MRFMVIVPATKESESGMLPDEHMLNEMGRFNEELAKAGMLLAAEGLHPSSKGVRIEFDKGRTSVTDGPFPDAIGKVAGFWLIEAPSMKDAVDWMKRAPFGGGVEIEVRPVFEVEEFGDAATSEIRERESRLRRKVAEQHH